MVNCIVTGAAGRMGRRLLELLIENPNTDAVCATERPGHELIGMDIGDYLGLGKKGCEISDSLAKVVACSDVVVDFTFPEVTLENARIASAAGKAMVIGSTGFKPNQLEQMGEFAKLIPVVLAPNMSVGVNLLLKVLKDMAAVLDEEYDVDIVETHHRHKKDAPSGTALKMAQVIAAGRGKNLDDIAAYCRHGNIGERKKGEIGIQTLRIGDVVGDHTVIFGTQGERVEITHKASTRDVFARGAVRAVQWVPGRKPGLYDMQDVLGIK